jgi:hypothetical protein
MPMEIHEDKIIMRAGKYNLPKPWVGLTDEEIDYYIVHRFGVATKKNLVELIRLCELKLKEKNYETTA